jgi:hypothetical protein
MGSVQDHKLAALDAAGFVVGSVADREAAFWSSAASGLTIANPAVETLLFPVYGHSYAAGPGAGTANAAYFNRLVARYGLQLQQRGVGGSKMQDVAYAIINGPNKYAIDNNGLVILDGMTNDVMLGNSARTIQSFKDGLRAALVRLMASAVIEQGGAAFAFSGAPAWTNLAAVTGAASSGTYALATNSDGAYIDLTVFADPVYLQFIAFDDVGAASNNVAVTVTNMSAGGAVILPQTDLQGRIQSTGNAPVNGVGYVNLKLTGHGGAANLRVLTNTLGRGNPTYAGVDCVSYLSANPPTVLVTKDPICTEASHNNAALYATLWAAIDEVCAEFPTAIPVDCTHTAGFDKTTMLGADGVHLNDRGQAFYAARHAAYINRLDYRNGLNTL